jgi:2-keto-4-pentenoate hydratase
MMTLDLTQDHVDEATVLLRAAETRQPVAPSSERWPGLTIDDGYRIQRALIDRRIAAGARIVGRKVGLTSAAMQEMLGVDQPDYGVLLDDMVRSHPAEVVRDELVAPRVEAEIAFEIEAPLFGPEVSLEDVLAATARVRPALEIIDSRVADWRIAIADTIADNASSAQVVLGAAVPATGLDLAAEVATVTIGDRSVSGPGSAVLGHPANAVAWLARTLAVHGEGLRPGDIVLPGAVAAALPFERGDVIHARFSTLGDLEVPVR